MLLSWHRMEVRLCKFMHQESKEAIKLWKDMIFFNVWTLRSLFLILFACQCVVVVKHAMKNTKGKWQTVGVKIWLEVENNGIQLRVAQWWTSYFTYKTYFNEFKNHKWEMLRYPSLVQGIVSDHSFEMGNAKVLNPYTRDCLKSFIIYSFSMFHSFFFAEQKI